MTHPDLVERLKAQAIAMADPEFTESDFAGMLEMRAADLILTLREEVKEAREDYFRRHNDAANAFEEIAVLQSQLAEARNSGLEECAELADEHDGYTGGYIAKAIRSLKSQEKKGE